MWELDYKENWAQKNWCMYFWTVVLLLKHAFELWCWRRLLRVPWTARRSNQSILMEIRCSLEGLMLKLKLQYFGHLMWRGLIWKDPDAGKDWRQEEKGTTEDKNGWMASPTQWTWVWVNSGSWWWTVRLGVLQSLGPQTVGHDWATELNWTVRYSPWSTTREATPMRSLCIATREKPGQQGKTQHSQK